MLNRREFLAGSTAMASAAMALPAAAFKPQALRAVPRLRRIYAKREDRGSWLLYSDGPTEAPKVIRAEVIEEVFGEGTYNTLSLRDHWAMIEAGWFSGPDLHLPVPLGDPTYDVWKGYYHPVTEAHDLLRDLFAKKYMALPRFGGTLPNGMSMGEHPNTPRYATARVNGDIELLRCHIDVSTLDAPIELVLPEELSPLRDEYSAKESYESLMSPMRPRIGPAHETGFQRWQREQRERHEATAAAARRRHPAYLQYLADQLTETEKDRLRMNQYLAAPRYSFTGTKPSEGLACAKQVRDGDGEGRDRTVAHSPEEGIATRSEDVPPIVAGAVQLDLFDLISSRSTGRSRSDSSAAG